MHFLFISYTSLCDETTTSYQVNYLSLNTLSVRHVARQSDGKWSKAVIEWWPKHGKRSVVVRRDGSTRLSKSRVELGSYSESEWRKTGRWHSTYLGIMKAVVEDDAKIPLT